MTSLALLSHPLAVCLCAIGGACILVFALAVLLPRKSRRDYYGYNCAICGEPIRNGDATYQDDEGLAHSYCCDDRVGAEREGL